MMIVGILSAAIILFINVVLKNFFASGITWAEEYAKYAIMWITFGGCGAAARMNAHMSITALYDAVNDRMKSLLDYFIYTVGALFSAFMMVYGMRLVFSVMITNQVSPTMELPMEIIYASVPLGGALMFLRFITKIIEKAKQKKNVKEKNT